MQSIASKVLHSSYISFVDDGKSPESKRTARKEITSQT